MAVEGQVVGAGDRADLRLVEAAVVGVGGFGISAHQQQIPGEVGPRVVVGDLEDLTALVVVARVGRVGAGLSWRAPLAVVGQRDIHLAGLRIGLEVLGAVHLGRAGLVGSHPGEHRHLLGGDAVHQRLGLSVGAAAQQRKPRSGAGEGPARRQFTGAVDLAGWDVTGQLGHIQRALVEDRHVVRHRRCIAHVRSGVLHLLRRHELVHVIEALVVAGVGDHGAVVGDVDVGAFVLEATHRGVLDRCGVRIPRVEFDDVTEPVGLVGCCDQVEARVEGLPLQLSGLQRDAVTVQAVGLHRRRGWGALGGTEVVLEVLFPGQHRAPRRHTAGAVGECACNGAALGIGGGLDELAADGGPGQCHRRVGGDAAVVAAHHRLETVGGALDLDDAHADRRDLDIELLAGGRVGVVTGEHELRCHVFEVGDQQETVAAAGNGQQTGEVVVEPELAALGVAGLVVHVERRRAGQHRVPPADHDGLLVTVGDDDRVLAVGCDRGEVHAGRRLGGGGRRRGRRRRGLRLARTRGQDGARADGEHRDAPGLQHRPPRQGFDDIAEVLVVAAVGHRLGAGVTALVDARDVLSLGLSVMRDKQIERHERHGGAVPSTVDYRPVLRAGTRGKLRQPG